MLPWSCSVRDYNLTIRIYSSSCSSVIYDRDIYIVLGGRVTIYSIIIKYIYNTSILRYSGIGIWSELNTCWYYYLNCSCLTVSSASFLTYFISNGIFAWSESTWYVDLTCGRIYSSTTIEISTLSLVAGSPPIVTSSSISAEPPVLGTRLGVGLTTISLPVTFTVAVFCLQV